MKTNIRDDELLNTAFHYVNNESDSSRFRKILNELKKRQLLNKKNNTGVSLADICIIKAKPNLLLSLLFKGFVIGEKEHYLLEDAIKESNKENDPIIDILIKYKANVNYINKRGRSLLHTAIGNRYAGNMDKLLKAGADPNVLDKNLYSPLSNALHYKKSDMVEILLKYSPKNHLSKQGRDLFAMAVKYHSKYVVPMIESGMQMIPIHEEGYDTILDYFSANYPKGLLKIIDTCDTEQLNVKSRYNRQYLIHDVASRRQYDILLKMIAHGADTTLLTSNNESVLYCIVKGETRFTPKIKKVLNLLLKENTAWDIKTASGIHILDVIQSEKIKNYILTYEKNILNDEIPVFNKKRSQIKRI